MQVAMVTGKGRVELLDMPQPEPEPAKAVVAIDCCGIRGTDVHAYLSGEPYNPAICGHEWAGSVSATGAGVTNVKEGDRVAIGVASACGRCGTCRRGDAGHCETVFASLVGIGPLHTGTVSMNGLAGAFEKLAEHPADIKILLDPRL